MSIKPISFAANSSTIQDMIKQQQKFSDTNTSNVPVIIDDEEGINLTLSQKALIGTGITAVSLAVLAGGHRKAWFKPINGEPVKNSIKGVLDSIGKYTNDTVTFIWDSITLPFRLLKSIFSSNETAEEILKPEEAAKMAEEAADKADWILAKVRNELKAFKEMKEELQKEIETTFKNVSANELMTKKAELEQYAKETVEKAVKELIEKQAEVQKTQAEKIKTQVLEEIQPKIENKTEEAFKKIEAALLEKQAEINSTNLPVKAAETTVQKTAESTVQETKPGLFDRFFGKEKKLFIV